MDLGEAVVLFQVRYLFWILFAFKLCHELKPVSHFFAVSLFNSGEVGFAGWILRHEKRVTNGELACGFCAGDYWSGDEGSSDVAFVVLRKIAK